MTRSYSTSSRRRARGRCGRRVRRCVGSARKLPSGKTIVGMMRLPSLRASTSAVFSGCSSRSTQVNGDAVRREELLGATAVRAPGGAVDDERRSGVDGHVTASSSGTGGNRSTSPSTTSSGQVLGLRRDRSRRSWRAAARGRRCTRRSWRGASRGAVGRDARASRRGSRSSVRRPRDRPGRCQQLHDPRSLHRVLDDRANLGPTAVQDHPYVAHAQSQERRPPPQ